MRKRLLSALMMMSSLVLTGCFAPVTGPQAVITTVPSPAQGEYPLAVTLDGTRSSGDIVQYLWFFGDDRADSGQTVSHTFAAPGRYTVVLEVVDQNGATDQTETTVFVHSKRPIAGFTMSPATGIRAGEEVSFDANASHDPDPDGTVAEYQWNFGDGSVQSTSLPTVIHTFREPGQYTVTLIVKDNDGVPSAPDIRLVPVGRGGCCGN